MTASGTARCGKRARGHRGNAEYHRAQSGPGWKHDWSANLSGVSFLATNSDSGEFATIAEFSRAAGAVVQAADVHPSSGRRVRQEGYSLFGYSGPQLGHVGEWAIDGDHTDSRSGVAGIGQRR